MQPIVLIVPKGPAPSAFEARRKEADSLRSRVQTCQDANSYFKSMQNAAIREIVVKTSADIPPVLRKLLDDTPNGHLTPPEETKQGVEMVALCARNPFLVVLLLLCVVWVVLFFLFFVVFSKAYLDEVRKAAMIEYRCVVVG